jgi:hypothetical protein
VNKEDIRSLTRISRSLWGDFNRSLAMSEDTLTSVSLLNLSDDRTIERASKVMIERAERNPPSLLSLNHPFFRLAAMERFLLTALHVEKWSYAKISRALVIDRNLIETWAWATRIKYCYQEVDSNLEYPTGPASLGMNCPEFDPSAPWSQRMLDDELGKRERSFLQNHLMACDRCRKTLDLTRRMMFKVEGLIPVKESSLETEEATDHMLEVWKKGEVVMRPITAHPIISVIHFLEEPRVQYILAGLTLFCLYWFTKHHTA